MPIKLPKGFPRRKSSGNVLDEVSTPKEKQDGSNESPSFRVLARPGSIGKSLDGAHALRPTSMAGKPRPPPKSSFDEDNEDLFAVIRNDTANRGSGTTNSLSTRPNDSEASSARYSNSSTNPSSVDSGSGRNVKSIGQRSYDDIPAPPPPTSRGGFLKNAGRTFSFGIAKQSKPEPHDLPPLPNEKSRRSTITEPRERTMTVSSVTTATAPRLDESNFSVKESDDDFGNMFGNLSSKQPSREHFTAPRPAPGMASQRAAPSRPIHVNAQDHIESSPYSGYSQSSHDGLIESPSPSRTVMQPSPQPSQPSTLRDTTLNTVQSDVSAEENMFQSSPLRRSPESVIVRSYASPAQPLRAPPSTFPTIAMTRTRTLSIGNSSIQKSDIDEYEPPPFDPSLLANAQLATRYEEKTSSTNAKPSKVMTPAEFERYKQQKEDTRKYNKVFGKSDSDNESGDDYDDDEEDQHEREKAALQQRKKQEAHLAVYRQQMMKVTGDATPEQRPSASLSPHLPDNSSQLDPAQRRISHMTLDSRQPSFTGIGKLPMDDHPEEDEDVPLGILAAHGFPNKNKPPTRLAASNSNPNLHNLAQSQGGATATGDLPNRGSVPAFARHLPVDPYYGASLVHQVERASLAMHQSPSQGNLTMQPQPSGAATAHPLHPAGLVGVIAGEERARAMRRGSPNPQGNYEVPPMGPQQNMRGQPQHPPNFPQQGMTGPQPMLTPSEQAQLQMSQSMTQMMQMQMQFMQQMTGMMGQNPSTMNMQQMQQFQQMQAMQQQMQQASGSPAMQPQHPGLPHRPQSVPLQSMHGPANPRTMSTLAPSMAGWNLSSPSVPHINPGGSIYAHSIAPSERSNIGLAQRYRPVSTMPQERDSNVWSNKRASTFSSATFRPWANQNENGNLRPPGMSTIRSVRGADDDEDDEQGWAEMKAKKEMKLRSWKLRKGGSQGNALREVYNPAA